MPQFARSLDRPHRILLCSVIGPYGVDDDFGRKENIMELLHNQVTKGQGIASFRFFHRSFGLYLIAANIDADVTVLDFPSEERFIQEIRRGYDIVGISFITPNFLKTQHMAKLIRREAPESEIILGGHGTAIPEVDDLIDCDHVARGDGVRWLRLHLGQDPTAPIAHPIMPNIEKMSAYGVPFPGTGANLLVPGVGCLNGCKFCSTSHLFKLRYTPYINSGRELFETACEIADRTGNNEFYLMDENFLKQPDRARDLLQLMEEHDRHFIFQIFSSAETILNFGIDNLVRLGVDLIWIGVEMSGEEGNYEKNRGIDARRLIKDLRDRGIRVLASGILCEEHHTPENIQADIDFMVDLESDFVQFMLLTALPTTALYRDLKQRGLLREDLPYEEWHGQKYLNYRHPAFPGDLPEITLNKAFRQDYEINSSSMYRVTETAFRGYCRLAAMQSRDACLEARLTQFRDKVQCHRVMLPVVAKFAVNDLERQRALQLDRAITERLGPPSLLTQLKRLAAPAIAWRWKRRVARVGDGIQPETICTHFPGGDTDLPKVEAAAPACKQAHPDPAARIVSAEEMPIATEP